MILRNFELFHFLLVFMEECVLFYSPVVRDWRVGLRWAVEFHQVALQNRLRLHGKIDKREIWRKPRDTETTNYRTDSLLKHAALNPKNLRHSIRCWHSLRLNKRKYTVEGNGVTTRRGWLPSAYGWRRRRCVPQVWQRTCYLYPHIFISGSVRSESKEDLTW